MQLLRTHSVFKDNATGNLLLSRSKESTLHLEHVKDPNYLGFITFELPGTLFTYTADGKQELNSDEVTELIEQLSDIRDNPSLWTERD
ncbi:hypothetical protein SAMN05421821_101384 [Mucilaginibacter lappiensis]|uniref:Uncharacterized protein n=1 Tax=Mucilaginibacter lappiensis TaxID=354630 RepID=A0ABR6PFA0_9SPHI|nr:hypothetical protein [Mucilaginibacter lappiensis]MBB6107700.1 hypothetical protein [Mucilaginibacter lappiensis]SIP99967.1 hypothetical protein SAMN05421821_101384 [Mucilaginibacter lappiensis]